MSHLITLIESTNDNFAILPKLFACASQAVGHWPVAAGCAQVGVRWEGGAFATIRRGRWGDGNVKFVELPSGTSVDPQTRNANDSGHKINLQREETTYSKSRETEPHFPFFSLFWLFC